VNERVDAPEPVPAAPTEPWHARSPQEVEERLHTGHLGLDADEIARRQQRYGPNRLEEIPPPSGLVVFLRQFRSPLIAILMVAAAVTFVLQEYIDATVIAAVLLINAFIGFTQERRAEESVRALTTLVAPRARVVRDGHEHDVASEELVPGDLVLLESGTRVPADLRLVSTTALAVDESLLTGESASVAKSTAAVAAHCAVADRTPMAFTGTVALRGRGRGYVVATGTATELGAIGEEIRGATAPDTPLQQRMQRFAHLIGAAVIASAAAAFAVGALVLDESWNDLFLVAVAMSVAAIPEGLPIVFTIALALGVRRMARRNAIIRQLPAVETLGSTTVVGSDKTGTLTENRMTVVAVWTPPHPDAPATRHRFDEGPAVDEPAIPDPTAVPDVPTPAPVRPVPDLDGAPVDVAVLAAILANEAEIFYEDDTLHTVGDPTEVALLLAGVRSGLEAEQAQERYPTVAEIPFESERRWAGVVCNDGDRRVLFAKGAPERILPMCIRGPSDAPLDPDEVAGANRDLASEGQRLLAVAMGPVEHWDDLVDGDREPEGLTFLGLIGMIDPPRAGVAEAVAGCQAAGMRVVMITGDHATTALAIARSLGIAEEHDRALTGEQLDDLDDAALADAVGHTTVYARVAPEHKLRVVSALQDQGEVVAVTGDGVNDAPALRRADIGVAMGAGGTDVAREAADMVLADDNFTSIHAAVEEGRVTFDNVRKVSFFLISTGVAAILTVFGALLLGWPLPFVPAQLLWMNLVTKGLQDVALAFEPGEPGVLGQPPRRRTEGILSPLLWERSAITGVVMATGTLVLFRWALDSGATLMEAQTVALTTMVIYQAFHLGNSRSSFTSVLRMDPFSNRFLLIAQVAALAVHVGALHFPPTQFVLRVEPLDAAAWVRIVAVSATILVAIEIHKVLRRPPTR
jgi:magnesium-transporting ATPase (P-type)